MKLSIVYNNLNGGAASYYVQIYDTTYGGVVAYSSGKYVYSPDKNNKEDVKGELFAELINSDRK